MYNTANTLKIGDFCTQMVDFCRPSHICTYVHSYVCCMCKYQHLAYMYVYVYVNIFTEYISFNVCITWSWQCWSVGPVCIQLSMWKGIPSITDEKDIPFPTGTYSNVLKHPTNTDSSYVLGHIHPHSYVCTVHTYIRYYIITLNH